jgi:hypothetical protein
MIRDYISRITTSAKLSALRNLAPNPSSNLKRRDEAVSTDKIFSDTPAINGVEKSAHLFVGKKMKLTDAYKSKDSLSAEFLKCLQDRV